MTDATPSNSILWIADELPPAYHTLFEELASRLPGSVCVTPDEQARIDRQHPSLVHAIGARALIPARRLTRRRRCPVVYEPEPLGPSGRLREALVAHACRPDVLIRRDPAAEAAGVPTKITAGLTEVALPPVVVSSPAQAPAADATALHVGIVIDGLGRRERRLLARALSWIPRDRGFVCLLFGSRRDCRSMARVLRWQLSSDESPVHLVERDRLQGDDWQRCAITVHTMRSTGSPQMLAEAMAAGTAVIAHDCDSSSLIVDGEDGLLIQPFNPFDLCRSLQYLQAQPGLLHMMADRGRETALARYDTCSGAGALCELYRRSASANGRIRSDESAQSRFGRRMAGRGTSKRYRDADPRERTNIPGTFAVSHVRRLDPHAFERSRP